MLSPGNEQGTIPRRRRPGARPFRARGQGATTMKRWTLDEEAALRDAHRDGMAACEIAALLDRTPRSVRGKLTTLGIARLPGAPERLRESPAAERAAARRGDLRFQRAMRAAIAVGTESPFVGVITTPGAPFARLVRPPSASGYRSSAAMCAEIGE
jgi:hypothetical protein